MEATVVVKGECSETGGERKVEGNHGTSRESGLVFAGSIIHH